MTSEFEIGDGTLRVLDKDGAFQRIQTPSGFTDYAFRNIVAATDTAYRLNGRFPSVTEVQKMWPKSTSKVISALFVTPEFAEALDYRGITKDTDSGLSMEQSMALLKMTDWTDRRSTAVKLRELGIPMARYQAWQQQPLFAEHLLKRTEDQFRNVVPVALNKLMANMESGDQRAVEKVLEITGRYNPAQQQIEDVRTILIRIVEAIIRNVHDPEVRRAIMNDIEAVTESHALLQTRQIEG